MYVIDYHSFFIGTFCPALGGEQQWGDGTGCMIYSPRRNLAFPQGHSALPMKKLFRGKDLVQNLLLLKGWSEQVYLDTAPVSLAMVIINLFQLLKSQIPERFYYTNLYLYSLMLSR